MTNPRRIHWRAVGRSSLRVTLNTTGTVLGFTGSLIHRCGLGLKRLGARLAPEKPPAATSG